MYVCMYVPGWVVKRLDESGLKLWNESFQRLTTFVQQNAESLHTYIHTLVHD